MPAAPPAGRVYTLSLRARQSRAIVVTLDLTFWWPLRGGIYRQLISAHLQAASNPVEEGAVAAARLRHREVYSRSHFPLEPGCLRLRRMISSNRAQKAKSPLYFVAHVLNDLLYNFYRQIEMDFNLNAIHSFATTFTVSY